MNYYYYLMPLLVWTLILIVSALQGSWGVFWIALVVVTYLFVRVFMLGDKS